MQVIPENEKVIKLDQDDDEGWVDTHHGLRESHEKTLEPPLSNNARVLPWTTLCYMYSVHACMCQAAAAHST